MSANISSLILSNSELIISLSKFSKYVLIILKNFSIPSSDKYSGSKSKLVIFSLTLYLPI